MHPFYKWIALYHGILEWHFSYALFYHLSLTFSLVLYTFCAINYSFTSLRNAGRSLKKYFSENGFQNVFVKKVYESSPFFIRRVEWFRIAKPNTGLFNSRHCISDILEACTIGVSSTDHKTSPFLNTLLKYFSALQADENIYTSLPYTYTRSPRKFSFQHEHTPPFYSLFTIHELNIFPRLKIFFNFLLCMSPPGAYRISLEGSEFI
mgnify:CR=1 FL=1